MIAGKTVVLFEATETGIDEFDRPIIEYTKPIEVDNVLISPATSEDVISELNLSGKRVVYNLAIPKGDMHKWENARVVFFGRVFSVVGIPTEGIEEMIPLSWNKKVSVELYE